MYSTCNVLHASVFLWWYSFVNSRNGLKCFTCAVSKSLFLFFETHTTLPPLRLVYMLRTLNLVWGVVCLLKCVFSMPFILLYIYSLYFTSFINSEIMFPKYANFVTYTVVFLVLLILFFWYHYYTFILLLFLMLKCLSYVSLQLYLGSVLESVIHLMTWATITVILIQSCF